MKKYLLCWVKLVDFKLIDPILEFDNLEEAQIYGKKLEKKNKVTDMWILELENMELWSYYLDWRHSSDQDWSDFHKLLFYCYVDLDIRLCKRVLKKMSEIGYSWYDLCSFNNFEDRGKYDYFQDKLQPYAKKLGMERI